MLYHYFNGKYISTSCRFQRNTLKFTTVILCVFVYNSLLFEVINTILHFSINIRYRKSKGQLRMNDSKIHKTLNINNQDKNTTSKTKKIIVITTHQKRIIQTDLRLYKLSVLIRKALLAKCITHIDNWDLSQCV